MEEQKKSVFEVLNAVNCNEHIEKKKQGNVELSYLSWAWAWGICKKYYPDAMYKVYENADGIPYFTDGRTCWVKTGVTIQGQEYIEYLPIMDFRNQSIPVDKVTSMDMNKAIQRSLTKCIGRHGLGLYVYAGEDLPEASTNEQKVEAERAAADLEQRRQEVLEAIPTISNLEESGNYWNWIKANFKEGTPEFKELKDALARRNRQLKAEEEKSKKRKAPKEEPQTEGASLESFNFDQIK